MEKCRTTTMQRDKDIATEQDTADTTNHYMPIKTCTTKKIIAAELDQANLQKHSTENTRKTLQRSYNSVQVIILATHKSNSETAIIIQPLVIQTATTGWGNT